MLKVRNLLGALPVACALTFGVFAPTAAQAGTVVVTASSPDGWAFDNRDSGGGLLGTTTGSFVNGPATPPLGNGSANLTLPGGTGDQGSELRNTGYYGTPVASINALSYSTYVTAFNGSQVPFLELYINSSTLGGDRWVFEPTYSSASQPAVAANQWQTWNALTGLWYDDAATDGSGPSVDTAITWSQLVAAFPDAVIVNSNYDSTGLGGVRFTVGFASSGETYNGYVDAFTIGTTTGSTTYDFEAAAATPLPAALPMFGSALGLAGLLGWRRKKKAVVA